MQSIKMHTEKIKILMPSDGQKEEKGYFLLAVAVPITQSFTCNITE